MVETLKAVLAWFKVTQKDKWPSGERAMFMGEADEKVKTPYAVLEVVGGTFERDSADSLDNDNFDVQVFDTTALAALTKLEALIADMNQAAFAVADGPLVHRDTTRPQCIQEDENLFRAWATYTLRVQRTRTDLGS